jgi:methylglutaconyl-CoA hydratase
MTNHIEPAAQPVKYYKAKGLATIVLDAPQRRNALSALMFRTLREVLDDAAADPAVRFVLLDHTGPVFSSGMDLTAACEASEEDQPIRAFPSLLARIWEYDKPVVAAVRGKARAGGIGLIACADIAIAVPAADFAFTEVRLGLVPAVVSLPVLQRMEVRAASELLLTGEVFDAARAAASGLITRVTADIDAEIARITKVISGCEPAALAETKRLLRFAPESTNFAETLVELSGLSARYLASQAGQEGVAAFTAKRTPPWAL